MAVSGARQWRVFFLPVIKIRCVKNVASKFCCCGDKKSKMTNSLKIRTIIGVCLVIACLILTDKIEGFSNLNLAYRAFIDVIVVLGALQLVNYTVKFTEKHH